MPQKVIVFPAARLRRFRDYREDGTKQDDGRFNLELDGGEVCRMLGDILTGTPTLEAAGVTTPARRAAVSHNFDQRFLNTLQADYPAVGIFDTLALVTPAWRP